MAEGKKSFVAYCDWGETFDNLSDDQAGRLAKHLFNYVRDLDPKAVDELTRMMFIPIQQTLKRDLVKYDKYIGKQTENGKKGGRPPKPKKPTALSENPTEPKKADSVSVSDIVNANVIVNDSVSVSVIKDLPSNLLTELLNASEWQFTVSRNFKVKAIKPYIEKYYKHLENGDDQYKEISEAKKHFANWLKIELKKEKTSDKKENHGKQTSNITSTDKDLANYRDSILNRPSQEGQEVE